MGWISVNDRLPKKDQLCVTTYKPVIGRSVKLLRHYQVGFGITIFGNREADYWQPLPEPPKE